VGSYLIAKLFSFFKTNPRDCFTGRQLLTRDPKAALRQAAAFETGREISRKAFHAIIEDS
jgi:hypothetical protein